ncbi:hypothetical protein NDU88_006600 [Pleurodeles waltl]|uniref:Uncharacterized protein n=1 Tax=Pleurodeles waltl TaxID=8319 RepID=A0AAV7X0P2_PLEWA|nr:hypothetical protein NDU88_006600 [Pleurodeles waltl]
MGPDVRRAAGVSRAWSCGGSSCGRLTAPLLPGAPWFSVCGSSESGRPWWLVVVGRGAPNRGAAAAAGVAARRAWLRWWLCWRRSRQGIRP